MAYTGTRTNQAADFETGDIICHYYPSDTICFEVIAQTPATVTLRETRDVTGADGRPVTVRLNHDAEPYPVVGYEQEADPAREPIRRRIRKDGTIRYFDGLCPAMARPAQASGAMRIRDYRD